MSIEIGGSGFLSGIGDTRTPALINSILNVLRLPLALIFMPMMGVAGVWIGMSLTSVFKGVIIYIFTLIRLKGILRSEMEPVVQDSL